MKSLSLEQMENVNGGADDDGLKFWDKTCALWAVNRWLKIVSFVTPATATLATAADIVCATYALARVATS